MSYTAQGIADAIKAIPNAQQAAGAGTVYELASLLNMPQPTLDAVLAVCAAIFLDVAEQNHDEACFKAVRAHLAAPGCFMPDDAALRATLKMIVAGSDLTVPPLQIVADALNARAA